MPAEFAVFPADLVAALPADLVAALPADLVAALPADLVAALPVAELAALPVAELVAALPADLVAALPADLVAALPVAELAALPVAEEPVLALVSVLLPSKALKRRRTAIPLQSRTMLSLSYPYPLTASIQYLFPHKIKTLSASALSPGSKYRYSLSDGYAESF